MFKDRSLPIARSENDALNVFYYKALRFNIMVNIFLCLCLMSLFVYYRQGLNAFILPSFGTLYAVIILYFNHSGYTKMGAFVNVIYQTLFACHLNLMVVEPQGVFSIHFVLLAVVQLTQIPVTLGTKYSRINISAFLVCFVMVIACHVFKISPHSYGHIKEAPLINQIRLVVGVYVGVLLLYNAQCFVFMSNHIKKKYARKIKNTKSDIAVLRSDIKTYTAKIQRLTQETQHVETFAKRKSQKEAIFEVLFSEKKLHYILDEINLYIQDILDVKSCTVYTCLTNNTNEIFSVQLNSIYIDGIKKHKLGYKNYYSGLIREMVQHRTLKIVNNMPSTFVCNDQSIAINGGRCLYIPVNDKNACTGLISCLLEDYHDEQAVMHLYKKYIYPLVISLNLKLNEQKLLTSYQSIKLFNSELSEKTEGTLESIESIKKIAEEKAKKDAETDLEILFLKEKIQAYEVQ